MDPAFFEIVFILALIAANGVFAMSEIAVVSARRLRLEAWAQQGDSGARAALRLAQSPSRFLSTVQLGITLAGILAGVIGGATLATRIAQWLHTFSPFAEWADALAIGAVVMAITYASLLLGELVPKRIALGRAEVIASRVAPLMHRFARLAAPAVALLTASTDAVLWLLRIRQPADQGITEEDVRRTIETGARSGAVEPDEREMLERILRFGNCTVADIMTPHPRVVWLDLEEQREVTVHKLTASGHSHFPVVRGKRDHVLGVVHAADLVAQALKGLPVEVEMALQPALFVPETTPALTVLHRFREAGMRVAIVIDEYGSLQGMVTTNDVLESIVGELPERGDKLEPQVIQRETGSWLIDGAVGIDELKAVCGLQELPQAPDPGYRTVGGLVMAVLGRIPSTGDHFTWSGFRFEVVDMDRRRVDKVLVEPLTE